MVIDNMARILHMEGADIGNIRAQHNGHSLVKIHTCAVNDRQVADKMASRKGFSDCDSDCTNTSMPEKSTSINTFQQWQGQYERAQQLKLAKV